MADDNYGVDFTGASQWEDNIKLLGFDEFVRGIINDTSPDEDNSGESNRPLVQLTNRTTRIKEILKTFGINVDPSDTYAGGQNVISVNNLRSDVVDFRVVSFYNNQFWLWNTGTNVNTPVGVAIDSKNTIITDGYITIPSLTVSTVGQNLYVTTNGVITFSSASGVCIGRHTHSNVAYINIGANMALLDRIQHIDGSGSGIDSDRLDGYHGSSYLRTANLLSAILGIDGSGSGIDSDRLDGYHGSSYLRTANLLSSILNVDGSGSGIDADRVDGMHASSFFSNSNLPYQFYNDSNGYMYFKTMIGTPGFTIQWMRIPSVGGNRSSGPYYFPMAFGTKCFGVWAMMHSLSYDILEDAGLSFYNLTSERFYLRSGVDVTTSYYVLAVGY